MSGISQKIAPINSGISNSYLALKQVAAGRLPASTLLRNIQTASKAIANLDFGLYQATAHFQRLSPKVGEIKAARLTKRKFGIPFVLVENVIANGGYPAHASLPVSFRYAIQGGRDLLIQGDKLNQVYDLLPEDQADRVVEEFLKRRNAQKAHLAWMEDRFLEMLTAIKDGKLAFPIPADQIDAPPADDTRFFEVFDTLGREEEDFRNLGKAAIANGELLAIDLAAGMAKGFGGVPKSVIKTDIDTRSRETRGRTYLDVKRENYLALQLEHKRHFIAAELVSDETIDYVKGDIKKFAGENNMREVFIDDGASREKVQEIWDKYKDHWQDILIIPLIRQPSVYVISKDGKSVGELYQKGHGDFFDIVKSQLKDIIKIFGIKYVFSSNIDNIGALVTRSMLGYFIDQVERNGLQAVMEVAEKFEGDKGGAPALLYGKLGLLEGPFVPKKGTVAKSLILKEFPELSDKLGLFFENPQEDILVLKTDIEELIKNHIKDVPLQSRISLVLKRSQEWEDKYNGRETFPYFNTNTFWWTAKALLETDFNLPMIDSNSSKKDEPFAKVETIMGQGLDYLEKWKALVIDRALRFLPAKFLGDLWLYRTDYITRSGGKLRPIMRNGEIVRQPLILLPAPKDIFRSVEEVDECLFAQGSQDSMRDLRTLSIGGERKHFSDSKGKYRTYCPVCYEGDVVIIFEHREGKGPGTLEIRGKNESDQIVLKDGVIFVPAGDTLKINHKNIQNYSGKVSKDITREDLETFLANAERWTGAERERVLNKFYPKELPLDRTISLTDLITSPVVTQTMDPRHLEQLTILDKVFDSEGSLIYEVTLALDLSVIENPELYLSRDGRWASLKVKHGSKMGIGQEYPSRAEKESVSATVNKGRTAINIPYEFHIDPIPSEKGDIFSGRHYVVVPYGKNGDVELALIIGSFNEEYDKKEKVKAFPFKLESIQKLLEKDRSKKLNDEERHELVDIFMTIPWADLFEKQIKGLYAEHIWPKFKDK